MSELSKRYEEQLTDLLAKWRKQDDTNGGVCTNVNLCCHGQCADELQPFLDSLPALKKEWEREAQFRIKKHLTLEDTAQAIWQKSWDKLGAYEKRVCSAYSSALNAALARED